MTGYGSEGPGANRPAFDQVAQASGGGMSITGSDWEHPVRAGIPIGDLGGGMFGVMGILAALYERERSCAFLSLLRPAKNLSSTLAMHSMFLPELPTGEFR